MNFFVLMVFTEDMKELLKTFLKSIFLSIPEEKIIEF